MIISGIRTKTTPKYTIGANLFFIVSLKKNPTNIYNNTEPIVVAVRIIKIPHNLPNTNPENIRRGMTKPKSNTQTIEKIKKVALKNNKFSFLYFKIMSLFCLMNS